MEVAKHPNKNGDVKIVGYVTRYYDRRGGILAMREYRTKSLTPMHAEIRKQTGGETVIESFDPTLYRVTGGLLGTFYEGVTGCGADGRHAANRKLALDERRMRKHQKATEK